MTMLLWNAISYMLSDDVEKLSQAERSNNSRSMHNKRKNKVFTALPYYLVFL